jgi:hypothetical protein
MVGVVARYCETGNEGVLIFLDAMSGVLNDGDLATTRGEDS